jgi:hypothetical protein
MVQKIEITKTSKDPTPTPTPRQRQKGRPTGRRRKFDVGVHFGVRWQPIFWSGKNFRLFQIFVHFAAGPLVPTYLRQAYF